MMKKIILILLGIIGFSVAIADTPAFPGAGGGGKYVTGGRGGTVYYVNSLADTSTGNATTREGTLRWCLAQSGKKMILFKVSGVIQLTKALEIKGDVTIAGQTAPGDGICLRDYEAVIKGSNVIVRYMRFRLGNDILTHEPDAFWGRNQANIIIDHCSVSWSIDETASFYSNENFTMQWCFITESLNDAGHAKGKHGYGGLWGGKNTSFHHNLLAHHTSRNPRFNGWKRSGLSYGSSVDEERVDYRNNVIYNWSGNSAYGGEAAGKYNMVANYYKYGPATPSSIRSRIVQISKDNETQYVAPAPYGQFYITDNYVDGNTTVTNNNWTSPGVVYDSGVTQALARVNEPFEYESIQQHTALIAFERVLDYGGASLVRDVIDTRIAGEVRNRTTTYAGSKTGIKGIIDSQNDVGGWPAYNQGTVPVDSDRDGIPDGWLVENGYGDYSATDYNEEGYTYLEVYLNSLVEDITYNQYLDSTPTGIESDNTISAENVNVHFGNSGNTLTVKAENVIREVNIYNLAGALVLNASVNSTYANVETSSLSKGVFIVKTTLENNSQVSAKIMK